MGMKWTEKDSQTTLRICKSPATQEILRNRTGKPNPRPILNIQSELTFEQSDILDV